jgi:hypothetical protein
VMQPVTNVCNDTVEVDDGQRARGHRFSLPAGPRGETRTRSPALSGAVLGVGITLGPNP